MDSQRINLYWHKYKFFPYEKKFGLREVEVLLQPESLEEHVHGLTVSGSTNRENIERLVYFSHAQIKEDLVPTRQFRFENGLNTTKRRQNTRYSVHGLHEYKGKFNPQVVHSLFNIYNIQPGDLILDPFCGSGTTLVEAALHGIHARGTDINPLAVFIANTKIRALGLRAEDIILQKNAWLQRFGTIRETMVLEKKDARLQYLRSWFPAKTLREIEALRLSALAENDDFRNIFLVIVSNLLREYSLQEPSDLRIRRRFSPFPETGLLDRVAAATDDFIVNLQEFQASCNIIDSDNRALLSDSRLTEQFPLVEGEGSFDFVITSPPYATALPYIDTQRLSLVWLGLAEADYIRTLEATLIGSREFKLKSEFHRWQECLERNEHSLPAEIHTFCTMLQQRLKATDGFRKQALPSLLYKYFHEMLLSFRQVHRLLKPGKYFCLIVGHNHTNIGGSRVDIDTPIFLSTLGQVAGFSLHELTELDAYQRYGIHSSNAVQKESLIVFRK